MRSSVENLLSMFGEKTVKEKSSFLFHIFFGILFMALAVLSLLAHAGREYILSVSVFSAGFLEVLLMLIGIFFIREAVRNKGSAQRTVHFFVGLFLFFFAIFPIFQTIGLLRYLPVHIDLAVSPVLLSVLLFFSGVFFLVDRFFLLVS